jgi:HEAT repeat protein
MMLEGILLSGATFGVLVWCALAVYVVRIDARRRAARTVVSTVLGALDSEDLQSLPIGDRLARVRPLLERVSRDMLLHTAADAATPRGAAALLTSYLLDRWGDHILLRDASSHRLARDVWRRTASLTVLFNHGHPQVFDLLARAVGGTDADVASVAFSLLGTSSDPRGPEILIQALKAQRHPASRIAVHLEHSRLCPAEAYRELLVHPDATVRFWGATLLSGYPEIEWVERELAPLVDDPDARVRKAAIQSLGKTGDAIAAEAALRLLRDPTPFVRAHAARALGELDCVDAAAAVAELLGDSDWWVRAAAKQALEAMGSDVWPVLMRCLEHADGFVRNGAAEVFQNLGLLDNLIILEAASDAPSGAKVDLLRRIASAGGTRLTNSLLERVGPEAAPRVRQLLQTIGLEQVGSC